MIQSLLSRFSLWGQFRQVWNRVPTPLRRPLKAVARILESPLLAPYRAQLRKILANHPQAKQIIVFAPSLAWYGQLFQRPQQLALALARQRALVFYIEPVQQKQHGPFQELAPGMIWCNVPVSVFNVIRSPLVYILTWNRDYLSAFKAPRVIYDFVDDIDVFHGDEGQISKEQIVRDHEKLVRDSTLLLVTAEDLLRQVEGRRPDAVLCPNGVDLSHFASTGSHAPDQPPADLAPILAAGKPIIGYHGALARWFDFELVKAAARCRPDLSFVLIGPDYDRTLPPSGVLELNNVHWLGKKDYADLPGYVRRFDVAMIPFQLNSITHATSPLKLFEYMAAGKPVVITPMRESMRYPGVLVAQDAQDFSSKLDQALKLRLDPNYLSQIERVAQENTWDARARRILEALAE